MSVCIFLIIGVTITGHLSTTADTFNIGSSPTASYINSTMSYAVFGNSTRTTLFNNVYSAFNLSLLIPIVAGAGVLLAISFSYLRKTIPEKDEEQQT